MKQRTVLDGAEIHRALTRIAHEVLEANKGPEGLVLLGIPTRGVPLAARLAEAVARIEPATDAGALAGALDITMHRDDLRSGRLRSAAPTHIPGGTIDARTVVLVDDVLFSGRSVRAALDAVSAIGRPHAVRLAVLVDRGHRRLPIRADHVGKNIPSALDERVGVRVQEIDGEDSVTITAAGGDGR
ncbi:bifunctional pyr operon transcriptional regulator/uracil phosphoribosyltransferase PyrR [Brevibacterium yomogidense]|uniref:bifunctional pyr operon transcriptional regulator/uracil phosphoribosyltransferase PyrR n=1 Tax=Brevibacterium yomogidense TaxID=946573 RepID=UPI0018DFBEB5|nr:bifunctional pyr operon transcriptional regulator/uracil phosphoribosyltransferase PyrR [Brevibacterium yomogidense]